jgi:hypothetical protein
MQDFVYVISVNEMKYLHYYSPKYGKAFTAPVLLYSLCKGRGNYHINDHIKEKDFFRVEKKLEEKGTFQFFFDPDFQRRWFEFEERMQLSKLETKAAREAKRKRKARGEDRLSKVRAAMGWCSNNDNETCRERRAAQARKATQPSGFDGRAYTACQNQKAQCMAQCEGFPDRDPRLGAIENALWGSSPRGKCRSKCYSISCY